MAFLDDRNRYILLLLLQDDRTATVANAFGTSYNAAAKAIQRVRKRISQCIAEGSVKDSFAKFHRLEGVGRHLDHELLNDFCLRHFRIPSVLAVPMKPS